MTIGRLRIVCTVLLLLGIIYLPRPAFSQEGDIQNLIVNGGFEGGFQEDFGVGYGWGGFSNGNAVVGWNFDDWAKVVTDGTYAQRIEIKDAVDLNRYAGIYQTVAVVPGQQYKLSISGLIRSQEGDPALSDFGYRMQYAVDYEGDIAWELIPESEWQELPWDEQPLSNAADAQYTHDTFETTITAQNDTLTVFIRGWKKWLNKGSGIYNLDQISFVGPAPAGFQAPVSQEPIAAAVGSTVEQPAEESVATDFTDQTTAQADDPVTEQIQVETETETQAEVQSEAVESNETETEVAITGAEAETQSTESVSAPANTIPLNSDTTLPVSGFGADESINYVVFSAAILLLILIVSAIFASLQHRNVTE